MRKQWKWIVVFLLAALLLTAIGIMLHVGKMDKIRHEELRRESMEAEEQGKENTVPETVDVDTSILPENQPHDLLIRNAVLGDALARTFSPDSQVCFSS